jgi:hypothetical protein
MFRSVINDAKSAVGTLIARYLVRASVAVPFLAALGFATAATTLTLIERFGTIAAYWIVAGGFTIVGIGAAVAVAVKEQEAKVAEKEAEAADTAEIVTETAARAATQTPLTLLAAVLATPVGPSTVAGAANVVARNIPLVVLLALIALLFWPGEPAANVEEEDAEAHVGGTNGSRWPGPNGFHHETAA